MTRRHRPHRSFRVLPCVAEYIDEYPGRRTSKGRALCVVGLSVLAALRPYAVVVPSGADEPDGAGSAIPVHPAGHDHHGGAVHDEHHDRPGGRVRIAALPVRQRVAQLVGIAIDGGALASEAQRAADLGVGTVLVQRPASTGRPRASPP